MGLRAWLRTTSVAAFFSLALVSAAAAQQSVIDAYNAYNQFIGAGDQPNADAALAQLNAECGALGYGDVNQCVSDVFNGIAPAQAVGEQQQPTGPTPEEVEAQFQYELQLAINDYTTAIDTVSAGGNYDGAMDFANNAIARMSQICTNYQRPADCAGALQPFPARPEPAGPTPEEIEAQFQQAIAGPIGDFQAAYAMAERGEDFATAQARADLAVQQMTQVCDAYQKGPLENCVGAIPPLPQPLPAGPTQEEIDNQFALEMAQPLADYQAASDMAARGDDFQTAKALADDALARIANICVSYERGSDPLTCTGMQLTMLVAPVAEPDRAVVAQLRNATDDYVAAVMNAGTDYAGARASADDALLRIDQLCDLLGVADIRACVGDLPAFPEQPATAAGEPDPNLLPQIAPLLADFDAAYAQVAAGDYDGGVAAANTALAQVSQICAQYGEPDILRCTGRDNFELPPRQAQAAGADGAVPTADPTAMTQEQAVLAIVQGVKAYDAAISNATIGDYDAARADADRIEAELLGLCQGQGYPTILDCVEGGLPAFPERPAQAAQTQDGANPGITLTDAQAAELAGLIAPLLADFDAAYAQVAGGDYAGGVAAADIALNQVSAICAQYQQYDILRCAQRDNFELPPAPTSPETAGAPAADPTTMTQDEAVAAIVKGVNAYEAAVSNAKIGDYDAARADADRIQAELLGLCQTQGYPTIPDCIEGGLPAFPERPAQAAEAAGEPAELDPTVTLLLIQRVDEHNAAARDPNVTTAAALANLQDLCANTIGIADVNACVAAYQQTLEADTNVEAEVAGGETPAADPQAVVAKGQAAIQAYTDAIASVGNGGDYAAAKAIADQAIVDIQAACAATGQPGCERNLPPFPAQGAVTQADAIAKGQAAIQAYYDAIASVGNGGDYAAAKAIADQAIVDIQAACVATGQPGCERNLPPFPAQGAVTQADAIAKGQAAIQAYYDAIASVGNGGDYAAAKAIADQAIVDIQAACVATGQPGCERNLPPFPVEGAVRLADPLVKGQVAIQAYYDAIASVANGGDYAAAKAIADQAILDVKVFCEATKQPGCERHLPPFPAEGAVSPEVATTPEAVVTPDAALGAYAGLTTGQGDRNTHIATLSAYCSQQGYANLNACQADLSQGITRNNAPADAGTVLDGTRQPLNQTPASAPLVPAGAETPAAGGTDPALEAALRRAVDMYRDGATRLAAGDATGQAIIDQSSGEPERLCGQLGYPELDACLAAFGIDPLPPQVRAPEIAATPAATVTPEAALAAMAGLDGGTGDMDTQGVTVRDYCAQQGYPTDNACVADLRAGIARNNAPAIAGDPSAPALTEAERAAQVAKAQAAEADYAAAIAEAATDYDAAATKAAAARQALAEACIALDDPEVDHCIGRTLEPFPARPRVFAVGDARQAEIRDLVRPSILAMVQAHDDAIARNDRAAADAAYRELERFCATTHYEHVDDCLPVEAGRLLAPFPTDEQRVALQGAASNAYAAYLMAIREAPTDHAAASLKAQTAKADLEKACAGLGLTVLKCIDEELPAFPPLSRLEGNADRLADLNDQVCVGDPPCPDEHQAAAAGAPAAGAPTPEQITKLEESRARLEGGAADPANSCQYAFDGECDDQSIGGTGACIPGTDVADCTPTGPTAAAGATPTNSCQYAFDGECDDPSIGGTGACTPGTDAADCGVDVPTTPAISPCANVQNGACAEPGIGTAATNDAQKAAAVAALKQGRDDYEAANAGMVALLASGRSLSDDPGNQNKIATALTQITAACNTIAGSEVINVASPMSALDDCLKANGLPALSPSWQDTFAKVMANLKMMVGDYNALAESTVPFDKDALQKAISDYCATSGLGELKTCLATAGLLLADQSVTTATKEQLPDGTTPTNAAPLFDSEKGDPATTPAGGTTTPAGGTPTVATTTPADATTPAGGTTTPTTTIPTTTLGTLTTVTAPKTDAEAQTNLPKITLPASFEPGNTIDPSTVSFTPPKSRPTKGGGQGSGGASINLSATITADGGFVFNLGAQLVISNPEQERNRIFDPKKDRIGYEKLTDDRVRETVTRPDGKQVITIRDNNGGIAQRDVVLPGGKSFTLAAGRPQVGKKSGGGGQWRDPGDDLPPLTLTISPRDYVLDADEADEDDIAFFLHQPPVERVAQIYTLDDVKRSPRIRDSVRRLEVGGLTFDSGKSTLPRSQWDGLEEIADAMLELLERDPAETFLIEGHTDAVGDELFNLELSDDRAIEVARILSEEFDVPPENLATQGYGETFLKVETDESERLNRRVTFRRITPLITVASVD